MKRRCIISLFMLILLLPVMLSAQPKSVGLVLSGGGSKGIAHIGFIQALEENGIPIDYVTGTSMGAIVGSLYASGYSPAEMMQLLASPGFQRWSTGVVSPEEINRFNEPEATSEWAGIRIGKKQPLTANLPTRLINPLPMSYAFMELFSEETGACGGDFDRLMVPFRCVASDIVTHRPVVFSHGQLADAVRGSMSFPLVFQPIMVDSVLLYDGGLYDVYPVDVMERDFNPDVIIGVDVSTPNTAPGLNDLIGQLENMIMIGEAKPVPPERGVNVVFDLERFGLLNWEAAPEIYAIGYRRGLELADSIKARVRATRSPQDVAERRARFRSSLKPTEFSALDVKGATPTQRDYIIETFNRQSSSDGTFSVPQGRDAFYDLVSTGKMRNLVPHAALNPDGSRTMVLDADIDEGVDVGVGGYLTSSTGSMLYASVKHRPLGFNKIGFNVEGWAGQSYLAAKGSIGTELKTALPMRIVVDAVIERTRFFSAEKLIFDFTEPSFLNVSNVIGRVRWEIPASRHGILTVTAGYNHQTHTFRRPMQYHPADGESYITSDLFELQGHLHVTTLDSNFFPTSGMSLRAEADFSAGKRTISLFAADRSGWDNRVRGDFLASVAYYHPLSRLFSLGASFEAFWSTRPLIDNYAVAIVTARNYVPVMSQYDLFDPDFRANQYLAVTLNPVVKLNDMFQFRARALGYLPMRSIVAVGNDARYSGWFSRIEALGEISAVVTLPIGTAQAFVDYRTSNVSRWSAGLSLGLFIGAL